MSYVVIISRNGSLEHCGKNVYCLHLIRGCYNNVVCKRSRYCFYKEQCKEKIFLIHGGVKVLYRFMVGLATFPLSKF